LNIHLPQSFDMGKARNWDLMRSWETAIWIGPNLMPQGQGISNKLTHVHITPTRMIGINIGVNVSDPHQDWHSRKCM
jgi:hypothetical protein